jgi:integral membrane protein (TIGR01906 family)
MAVLRAVLTGVALALLVVGISLYPMLHPTYTRLLSERYSLVSQSGLSRAQILSTAEQVRAFVADGDVDYLPATVDGRPGFDPAAVSHLRDVRGVLSGARTFTGVLAALTAVGLGLEIARRRFREIATAMFVAAGVCAIVVVLGVIVGSVNFEGLFVWFHGLFFKSGTWQFPYDSLLIEVFPEGFWIAAGATWGALVLVGGALLAAGGWFVRSAETNGPAVSANRRDVNGA